MNECQGNTSGLSKNFLRAPGGRIKIPTTDGVLNYRPVRFAFHHSTAKRVFLAGSFNDWNPSVTPLVSLGHGQWLRLLWLPAGPHEYLFVADNIWLLDPEADDYVPNVYGTMNAVANVAATAGMPHDKRPGHHRKACYASRKRWESQSPGPSFENQL